MERASGLFDNDDALAALQDSKIEALMVSMLDQRDKLTDQLQKSQRRIDELEDRLRDSGRESDSLRRQMELQAQHLPAVSGFGGAGHIFSGLWPRYLKTVAGNFYETGT